MDAAALSAIAAETVAICAAGTYTTPAGTTVDLRSSLAAAIAGTQIRDPRNLLVQPIRPRPTATPITVVPESTLDAIRHLAAPGRHTAALNFASARNPGGGFLHGTVTQEESLAYASGLHACLSSVPEFYARGRAGNALYPDLVIWSPNVPFFRDPWHNLVETPVTASVITAAAPNAAALRLSDPGLLPGVTPALGRRIEMILALAAEHEVDCLILGAWGCGVFGNDPAVVARLFARALGPGGPYHQAFAQVVFAIPDRGDSTVGRLFARALAQD